jgi:flagellar protein FliS
MTLNPYQQYQTTQVQTASTGELILLLYDGAVRFLSRAQLALDERRLDAASADIVRGQDIILELFAGLDYEQGGELAGSLRDLYLFMYQTLLQANLKKDTTKIQTVIRLLDQVRDAWRTVVRGPAAAVGQHLPAVAGGIAA